MTSSLFAVVMIFVSFWCALRSSVLPDFPAVVVVVSQTVGPWIVLLAVSRLGLAMAKKKGD